MKLDAWYKEKIQKFRNDVEFMTESVILDITEKIVDKMHQTGLSRVELSQKLGVSKPFITKLLNGNPNMTIKTMVAIAHALDCELNFDLCPKGFEIRVLAVHKKIDAEKFTETVNPFIGEGEYANAA